jgi:AraC family transcriptional regulator, arabinose operon regulatory protein
MRLVVRRSGFAGERLRVLPPRTAAEAAQRPLTRSLLVTDCGYFPHATGHERSRPHGAPQAIVIVCTEGEGWCRSGGAHHRITAGNALVIRPREPHVYGADSRAPWSAWWLHVVGEAVPDLLDALEVTPARPVVAVSRLSQAVSLVDEAIKAFETDESPSSLAAASGAAWHLFASLASGRHRVPHGRPDPVALATAKLQQDLTTTVAVADLAASVGLSSSHLSALFRRAVGCGPAEYQTRLRMSAARELLDTTDLPVASVARRVGYADPFYFARKFRAAHGTTPSEYRSGVKG